MVHQLLETLGIDLNNGAGIPEPTKFQEHFCEYKIVVYTGLNCDSVIFQGQTESEKRINLLCDETMQHYHVIANLTGTMAKRYICEACNRGCKSDVVHTCDLSCSDRMTSPPCVSAGNRIACDLCNRHFRSQICFDNHKIKHGRMKKVHVIFVNVVCVAH
jgi:hypothetical protein